MENSNFLGKNQVVSPDVRFIAYLRWLIFFSGTEIVLGICLAAVGVTGMYYTLLCSGPSIRGKIVLNLRSRTRLVGKIEFSATRCEKRDKT